MKKFYSFLFAAVALVGFAACNSDSTEEPAPEQEVGKMEFTANIGEGTKTSLDGVSVMWCESDAIAVSNGKDVKKYEIKLGTLSDDRRSATFTGDILEGNTFYAIYPYNENAKCDNEGNWTGVVVPTEQKATAGSFADGAAISTAKAEGNTLTFQNTCAVLKFQVPTFAEGIHKVEFMDQNNENARLVLIEKDNANLTNGNVYYAVVNPGSYKLLVRINGYLSKESSKNADFTTPNTIYNLGTLPAPEKASWNIRGSIATSNWGIDLPLYKYDNNGNQVITNLNFGGSGEFKFYNSTSAWSGYTNNNWADKNNGWMWIIGGGGNNIPVSGTVDIYVNDSGWAYKIVPTGEYPF